MIEAHTPAAPQRIGRGRAAAVLLVAAVLGVGLGVLLHGVHTSGASGAPAPAAPAAPASTGLAGQATWAAGARPAPAIRGLRDQDGSTFALAALRGHPIAMTFLDSHCNQACPLEGRALAAALWQLPAAARPALVLVSVNPRDTPASERAAVGRWGLPPDVVWHWLAGPRSRLAPVWRAYRVFVAPGHGDIAHTEALYLIDRRGDERSGYLFPFLPASVGHDLSALARARHA